MILLLLPLFATVAALEQPEHAEPRPMVCNNGTDHMCICGPETPIPNTNIIPCDQFLQTQELSVVDLRARHVNLEAHLHTNENYETYFKRRIAQIVSAYCERQVNECPGVTLRLQESEDVRVADDKSVLYSADESEPLLTQDNVVLLRVEREPGNVTRILFAIIKSDKISSFTENDIIEPNKVKVILGSQAVPLSRILGGIKLESVRVSRIRRQLLKSEKDNTNLIIIVLIVTAFFVTCWIIGGWKLYRLHREKKTRAPKQLNGVSAEGGLAATTTVPNYGTLTSDGKPVGNGSTLNNNNHNNTEHPITSQYQKIDEIVSDEPCVLSDRQARFMFMCDDSQLPREPTFDSQSELLNNVTPKSTPPREEMITEEHVTIEPLPEQPAPFEQNSPVDQIDDNQTNRFDDVMPPPELVVVSSLSMNAADSSGSSMESPASPVAPVIPKERLLSGSQSPPMGRPRSRRGSRVDEEQIDMTELGIDRNPMFTDLVIPDDIKIGERPQSADRWSSSEGEVDLYYKLSDDEEIKGDNWNKDRHSDEESEAENENDLLPKEDAEAEAFVYERLREDASPMPPRDHDE